MLTSINKILVFALTLFSVSAYAGSPVIFNGSDAKFLNSGSLIIPGLSAHGACTLSSTKKLQSILGVSLNDVLTWNGTDWVSQSVSSAANTVPNGLTGNTSFLANQILLGGTTSTAALTQVPGAVLGNVLISQGVTAAPAFGSISAIGISTDWKTFPMVVTGSSVNPTKGTIAVDTAQERQIGDSMQIHYEYRQTGGGGSGTGTYLYALPSGYTIDSTKAIIGTTNNNHLPNSGGIVSNSTDFTATSSRPVNAIAYDSTHIALSGLTADTWPFVGSPNFSYLSTNLILSFDVTVPITGWSSNTIGTGQGTVVLRTHLASNVSPGANGVIKFDTVDQDTSSGYSASTGLYTAPVSASYTVNCGTLASGSAGQVYVKVNGVSGGYVCPASVSIFGGGSLVVNASAGQTIGLYSDTANTILGGSAPYFSTFTLSLNSGNAGAGPGAPVTSRYYNSATSISGALTTISWTTQDYDNTAMCSGGTCTIPAGDQGKYSVCTALTTAGTIALNSLLDIQIQKNGTAVSEQKLYAGGAMTDLNGGLCDTLNLIAGDTVRVQASSSATLPTITSSNTQNYMTMVKVSN